MSKQSFLIIIILTIIPSLGSACYFNHVEELPDQITWRDGCASFNQFFYFALVNGRLYSKPRKAELDQNSSLLRETKIPQVQWELYQETGLPERKEKADRFSFLPPEALTQISADDDEVVVLDNLNQIYFDRVGSTIRFDDHWYAVWGAPIRQQFHFPLERQNNLGWAIGRRRQDSTAYSNDIIGNEHWSYVGITTMYLLDKNESDIYFADTGLPSEMSHRMCGPRNNTEKLLAISASGSTMMVLTKGGQILTRLEDFDTKGGNPAFQYTYDLNSKAPPQAFGSPDKTQVRVLPGHAWHEHAPLPKVDGLAAYTRLITLTQTGQGNQARELRIFGTNRLGQWGYYSKSMNAGQWQFVEVDDTTAKVLSAHYPLFGTELNPFISEKSNEISLNFSGNISFGSNQQRDVSLSQFSWLCSPAQISIELKNGDRVDGQFHLTDAWSPLRNLVSEQLFELSGQTYHSQLGNVVFSEEQLDIIKNDPELYAYLNDINMDAFTFWVEGNNNALSISRLSGIHKTKMQLLSDPTNAGQISEASEDSNMFSALLNRPEYLLTESGENRVQVLVANQELLEDLSHLQNELVQRKIAIGLFRGGIVSANFLYHGLGVSLAGHLNSRQSKQDPRLNFDKKTVTKQRRNEIISLFNSLLKMNNRQDRHRLGMVYPDLIEAKSVVRQRIRKIKKMDD